MEQTSKMIEQTDIMELLEELYAYSMHGIKLGLDNIRQICQELGNPQKAYQVIHVAGTNGKGSVTATIANVLQCAGYRVGRYTSPHILTFNERISFNGINISDTEIAQYYHLVKEAITRAGVHPTFFEVTTAMMFRYFSDVHADYVVLETGMGGRFDATNICDDLIAIITNVSLEHTEYLGNTIYQIAGEKAGIIKNCQHVIVADHDPDFLQAILEQMPAGSVPINVMEKYRNAYYRLDDQKFRLMVAVDGKNYYFSLFGDYQYPNFLCAYEALQILKIPEEALRKGFATTQWECRFELWSEQPLIILDGAHNEAGMAELAKTIKKHYRKEDTIILTSILKDKNISEMVKILDTLADVLIFTEIPDNPRGLRGEELIPWALDVRNMHIVENNLEKAFKIALENSKKLILICGSFYLLSKFKETFPSFSLKNNCTE